MANITIPSGTYNHDDAFCTGLLNGESYTINGGGTLIINSDTAWGYHGKWFEDLTINDGTVFMDGRTVRSIWYTGNTGPLPPLRSILTGLTSNVTGEVIYTGHRKNFITQSGELKVRSLSGPMSPNEQFASASFTGYVSGVDKVGWIYIPFEDTHILTTSKAGSWIASGDWYNLGVSDGTTGQIFRHYIDEPCPAIWVETGVGANVFKVWTNFGSLMRDGYVASGTIIGNVFRQETGSYNIVFGNNIVGEAPMSGVRLRTPNIQLAATNLGFWTETGGYRVYNPSATFQYGNSSNYGGVIILDKINTNGKLLSWSPIDIADLKNVGIFDTLLLSYFSTMANLSGVGIGTYTGMPSSQRISFNLSSAPLNINDCNFLHNAPPWGTAASNSQILFSDLLSGVIKNTFFKAFHSIPNGASYNYVPYLNRCKNLTFENCSTIGSRTSFYFQYCDNINLINCSQSSSISGIKTPALNNDSSWFFYIDSLNSTVSVNGFSSFHSPPQKGITIVGDNVIVENIGNYNNFVDFKNTTSGFLNLGKTTNSIFQRIYLSGITGAQSNSNTNIIQFGNSFATASDNIVIQNFYAKGGGMAFSLPAPKKMVLRGCYFQNFTANWGPDATAPINPTYDSSFYDYFYNDNTGRIGILTNPTIFYTGHYSGNIYGFYNGNLYFDNNQLGTGRFIDYTWPYYIKGYTGFQQGAIFGASNQNISVLYQLDKGSGIFDGNWKVLTGELKNESVDPTIGFKPKLRLMNTANNVSLTYFYITGLTNWETIISTGSLYPSREISNNFTIDGLITGSEVRIYNANTNNELYGIENCTSSTFTYPYIWYAEDIPINIAIMSLGYVPIRYENQILGENGLSLFVQQKLDRVYDNPA